MRNQAQFHPLKYLAHLSNIITEKGGYIFENTTAVNIKQANNLQFLPVEEHKLQESIFSLVLISFYEGAGLYSTRMHADRSYIIAAKTKQIIQVVCILV